MRSLFQPLALLACLPIAAYAQENAPEQPAPEPVAAQPPTFGSYTYDTGKDAEPGDEVQIRLTIRRAPETEVEQGALCVEVTVFRLTGGLDILPSPEPLTYTWNGGDDAWVGHELPVTLTYTTPAPEAGTGESTKKACYGFTARLLYHGEVVDTLSTSDELLPHDEAGGSAPPEAAPEPEPTEEAIIYSDFLKDNPQRRD